MIDRVTRLNPDAAQNHKAISRSKADTAKHKLTLLRNKGEFIQNDQYQHRTVKSTIITALTDMAVLGGTCHCPGP